MGHSAVVVIQARLGSTRLPEKIIADLAGKPLLQHVIDRAEAITGVDDVVVAVPDAATRQRLQEVGIASMAFPQLHENDVLGRFAAIARQFQSHDIYLRLTGDCPLLDSAIASAVLARFLDGDCDYCTNVTKGYSDGTDVEVFSREALLLADAEATNESDREHVCPWMRANLRVAIVAPPKGVKPIKISVDDAEDLARVRALIEASE